MLKKIRLFLYWETRVQYFYVFFQKKGLLARTEYFWFLSYSVRWIRPLNEIKWTTMTASKQPNFQNCQIKKYFSIRWFHRWPEEYIRIYLRLKSKIILITELSNCDCSEDSENRAHTTLCREYWMKMAINDALVSLLSLCDCDPLQCFIHHESIASTRRYSLSRPARCCTGCGTSCGGSTTESV